VIFPLGEKEKRSGRQRKDETLLEDFSVSAKWTEKFEGEKKKPIIFRIARRVIHRGDREE